VRTPARAERASTFDTLSLPPREDGNPFPLPVRVLVKGSRDFDSEDLIAYEAGYRGRVAEKLFVDIAGFYYDYQHLRAADSSRIYADTTLSIPALTAELVGNNLNRGRSYGIEGSMDWLPLSWLRIQAYYAYFRLLLRHKGDTLNPFNEQAEGLSPRHQASLRSSFDISRHLECDVWMKFVDKLPMINADRRIDLSVRLGWMPLKNLEISMVGQNLLDGSHYEFSGTDYIPVLKTEVQRGVYGKITWKF
jgi:iron complex outermembrane receptor protein